MADSRWRGSKDEGVWGGGSGERGDRGHCEEGGEGHRFREEVSKTEKKKKKHLIKKSGLLFPQD